MRKLILLAMALALPLRAEIALPPAPTTYVTDAADVLDDEREEVLNERLAKYEAATSHQLIVYVDRRLPAGTTIEELATAAANTWRIGDAEKNKRVILFLFIDDRESRLEVGSGPEPILTPEAAKQILVDIQPRLRAGVYTAAVEDAVDAIRTAIARTPPAPLPAPTRYVTDRAGVLDDPREEALNERLAEYDRNTSIQFLVYVDRKIPVGTTIEELATTAINSWGVGDAKKDNGIILFLFLDDRESRLEVGYGLESILTKYVSKQILVDMRPELQSTAYTAAVEHAVDKTMATIAQRGGTQAVQRAYGAGTPVREVVPRPPVEERNDGEALNAMVCVIALIVIVAIIVLVVKQGGRVEWGGRNYYDNNPFTSQDSQNRNNFSDSSPSSWSSSDSSSSSSHSSSPSSSSFHGGGGSGGGGGASDKW